MNVKKPGRAKSTLNIPTLNSIRTDTRNSNADQHEEISQPTANLDFTFEKLKEAWNEFAETRKKYKAEYQVLTQEIELKENTIVVHLHNPVQDTLLNDLKTDITTFIREKLGNTTIQLTGELISEDDKKVIYTNREKFDHLAEKNPSLRDLKNRLGLDTDF